MGLLLSSALVSNTRRYAVLDIMSTMATTMALIKTKCRVSCSEEKKDTASNLFNVQPSQFPHTINVRAGFRKTCGLPTFVMFTCYNVADDRRVFFISETKDTKHGGVLFGILVRIYGTRVLVSVVLPS